jgi:serine phosphatase RsbU (regulator of sigma subunit)
MLESVNDALLKNFDGTQFCTVALGIVQAGESSARLSMTLGGHPAPFILRADGRVDAVGATGSLLGVLDHPDWQEVEMTMADGDTLLLYTDGATETRTKRGRLGADGLERILRRCGGLDAMAVVTRVENEIALRRQDDEVDDLALLAMRFAKSS